MHVRQLSNCFSSTKIVLDYSSGFSCPFLLGRSLTCTNSTDVYTGKHALAAIQRERGTQGLIGECLNQSVDCVVIFESSTNNSQISLYIFD